MGLRDLIFQRRTMILEAATRNGLSEVRLFGSAARGEDTIESDIDFLVTPKDGVSLLGLGGFLMDMQDLFGRRVDVATPAMLKPGYREAVLREAMLL